MSDNVEAVDGEKTQAIPVVEGGTAGFVGFRAGSRRSSVVSILVNLAKAQNRTRREVVQEIMALDPGISESNAHQLLASVSRKLKEAGVVVTLTRSPRRRKGVKPKPEVLEATGATA